MLLFSPKTKETATRLLTLHTHTSPYYYACDTQQAPYMLWVSENKYLWQESCSLLSWVQLFAQSQRDRLLLFMFGHITGKNLFELADCGSALENWHSCSCVKKNLCQGLSHFNFITLGCFYAPRSSSLVMRKALTGTQSHSMPSLVTEAEK